MAKFFTYGIYVFFIGFVSLIVIETFLMSQGRTFFNEEPRKLPPPSPSSQPALVRSSTDTDEGVSDLSSTRVNKFFPLRNVLKTAQSKQYQPKLKYDDIEDENEDETAADSEVRKADVSEDENEDDIEDETEDNNEGEDEDKNEDENEDGNKNINEDENEEENEDEKDILSNDEDQDDDNVEGHHDDESTEKYDPELERLKDSPFIYNAKRDGIRPVKQGSLKVVSAYLPYDEEFLRFGTGGSSRAFKGCPYNNCQYTRDIASADAVLFRAGSIRNFGVKKTWYRSPKQRWVMVTIDPATKDYKLSDDRAVSEFNWTSSYQLSSDIPRVLGKLYRRLPPPTDYEEIYNSKTKLAAWFVSNCNAHSRRSDYVKRMQEVADIDIFGACGTMRCGTRWEDKHSDCFPLLNRTYKFYLSFESSLCKDYVTEKYFKLFNNIHVVPVVRGAVDYDKFVPRNTYVNAGDFDSPEDLARYLIKLGNNKKRYLSILKEKNRWGTYVPMWNCDLCEKLHTDTSVGHIENLKEKFEGTRDDPECWAPDDL